jgi:hypothetical protein
MACLTYFPGTVNYQNYSIRRLDLINMKKKLLDIQMDKLLKKGNFADELQTLQTTALNFAKTLNKSSSKSRPGTSGFYQSRRNLATIKVPTQTLGYHSRLESQSITPLPNIKIDQPVNSGDSSPPTKSDFAHQAIEGTGTQVDA